MKFGVCITNLWGMGANRVYSKNPLGIHYWTVVTREMAMCPLSLNWRYPMCNRRVWHNTLSNLRNNMSRSHSVDQHSHAKPSSIAQMNGIVLSTPFSKSPGSSWCKSSLRQFLSLVICVRNGCLVCPRPLKIDRATWPFLKFNRATWPLATLSQIIEWHGKLAFLKFNKGQGKY